MGLLLKLVGLLGLLKFVMELTEAGGWGKAEVTAPVCGWVKTGSRPLPPLCCLPAGGGGGALAKPWFPLESEGVCCTGGRGHARGRVRDGAFVAACTGGGCGRSPLKAADE